MIKIALFGWFGRGALADDLICAVTKAELEKLGCIVTTGGWKRGNALIKQLKNFDKLIFGGGSLLCPTKIHPMSGIQTWFTKVNRPLYLFGTGFRKETSILNEAQKQLNTYLFTIIKKAWPRGHVTKEELLKNKIHGNFVGFGDPGMLFTAEKQKLQGPAPHLGIVARNIPEAEKCFVENKFVHKFYIQFINAWLKKHKGSIHYISFRHIKPVYDNDMHAMNYIASQIKHKNQYKYLPKTPKEAGDLISSVDYAVAQRLHPTIVAVSNQVRCVGLDYQFRKMEDFASVVDFKYWMTTRKLNVNTTINWLENGKYEHIQEKIINTRKAMRKFLKTIINE